MLKKGTHLYIVKALVFDRQIQTLGREQKLPMTWDDGMVGVMPVYDNYEDALRYVEGKEEMIFKMITE